MSDNLPDLARPRPLPVDPVIAAVMDAAAAAFDPRGERDLTMVDAVRTCAALIAFLQIAEQDSRGWTLSQWVIAIENLRLDLSRGRQP